MSSPAGGCWWSARASMAGLAARTAAAAGAQVSCANRTLARAQILADAVGGRAVSLAELPQALAQTDVLVTCTGARSLTLTAADLVGTPVVGVVDLALPADVAPEVAALGVSLVNLDRLVTDQAAELDSPEIEDGARPGPARRSATSWGCAGPLRSPPPSSRCAPWPQTWWPPNCAGWSPGCPRSTTGSATEVQRSVRRIVDKLLHAPTVRVQELSADPEAPDYAAALRELFALDPQAVAAVLSPEVRP